MTKTELITNMNNIIKEDGMDTRIESWLNQALITISSQFDLPELLVMKESHSTTVNSPLITLHTECRNILDVMESTSMKHLSKHLLFEIPDDTKGTPYKFYHRDEEIILYPTPQAVIEYLISYYKYDKFDSDGLPKMKRMDNLIISTAMMSALSEIPLPTYGEIWIPIHRRNLNDVATRLNGLDKGWTMDAIEKRTSQLFFTVGGQYATYNFD